MLRLVQVLMGLGIPEASRLGKKLLTHVLSQLEKVLDVITKFYYCKICQEKRNKCDAYQMTTLQYLTCFIDHESKCLMNHEGSASVSDILKYIHRMFSPTQMHVLLFRSQILNALVSHCSI